MYIYRHRYVYVYIYITIYIYIYVGTNSTNTCSITLHPIRSRNHITLQGIASHVMQNKHNAQNVNNIVNACMSHMCIPFKCLHFC